MVATTISLKKDNLIKKGFVGFSWTTLFFGFLVPITRGDVRWAIVMFSISFINWFINWLYQYPSLATISGGMLADIDKIPDDELESLLVSLAYLVFLSGLSLGIEIINRIIFAFIYNKQYTTKLLESGYEPADEYSRGVLRSRGMIA
ncbi:hypothetical protein ID1001_11720 [Helicobacter pylori]|nr:HrgC protein [Helicobacter pylori]